MTITNMTSSTRPAIRPTSVDRDKPAIPVEIEVSPIDTLYQGEWTDLHVVIRPTPEIDEPLQLQSIGVVDTVDFEVDTDLFVRGTVLNPLEEYILTLPVRPKSLTPASLSKIYLQVDGYPLDVFRFPNLRPTVYPSLCRELALRLETVCPYDAATKVALHLEHVGTTEFRDLVIRIDPSRVVRAGIVPIHRTLLKRHDRERFELIVATDELALEIEAKVRGETIGLRHTLPVPTVDRQVESPRFRFLKPRPLSHDAITIEEHDRKGNLQGAPLTRDRGEFPMRSGRTYAITIVPQQGEVDEVTLREIPNKVHIRTVQPPDLTAGRPGWRFFVELPNRDNLFSEPERLHYDLKAGEEIERTGEIRIKLEPVVHRHFRLALALGIALTVQGIVALGRFILDFGVPIEEILVESHLTDASDPGPDALRTYRPLLALSILPIWLCLHLLDWIVYRFRS